MSNGFSKTVVSPGNDYRANKHLAVAASVPNLSITNYLIPGSDGIHIQAIPVHMALKFKPPTIAVVYITKDKRGRVTLDKRGKQKKFHK
jgi:hypothetical protein|tara:strand:+ start:138 stop:404 length:267 start_codon:yes stop_codon:yes gene_type:complete